jgi:hypothetical protein
LLLDDTAGRTDREFWWTNQEFPLSILLRHGSPQPYIAWKINRRPADGSSLDTWSHSIDMITITMIIVNIQKVVAAYFK